MTRKQMQITHFPAALALGLGLVLLAPAAFGEIYSWRTDDGGFAYSDDRDQVPARYASQIKVVPSRPLEGYDRFTPQDAATQDVYAERVSERLQYLRQLNAPTTHPVAARAGPAPQRTISLSTGDRRAPEIQIPVGGDAGPIIIEPVNAKRTGDVRTRRVTVVRQGDQTIAVIKGNPHHFNVANDIHDEEELEAGAPLR